MLGSLLALQLALIAHVQPALPVDGEQLFRERVAPILEAHCLRCHGDGQQKGDLSFAGPELPADLVVPGDPDGSLLLEVVSGVEPQMPQKAQPLSEGDVLALRDWIAAGAPWVPGVVGAETWWSLQALDAPTVPDVPGEWSAWARGPIDAFVLERLTARGLTPSPAADRRTLLRRLHFDLVGLPPDSARLAAFLVDASPDAYEREVDRLLASPRHGERWARHWLDVVHYADTHGYDKDKPRPNAWPYRDWVIDAFNDDLPWRDFVRDQIAGDVLAGGGTLESGDPSRVVATGMLAAGPWDYVGHVELREGTVDKKKTRNLDRDDVVTNVVSSFQSLTVHCARCHDHKFDPIPQRDYYNLQAVFAGVERADRDYDANPETAAARAVLVAERAELRAWLLAAKERLDERMDADASAAELRAARERMGATVAAPDRSAALGYHSSIERSADVDKWVRIDLGAQRSIDRVVVYPCDEVFGGHPGPGFGWPAEFTVRLIHGDEAGGPSAEVGRWRARDAGPRHGDRPIAFDLDAPRTARFVELRIPVGWERTADFCVAFAEVEAWSGPENVALGADVSAADTIEAGERWGRRFLVDGKRPWSPEMARVEDAERALGEARARLESAPERDAKAKRAALLDAVERSLAALPARERVYAMATDFASEGAFSPPPGGAPRAVHRLERGDVEQPAEPSWPGAISALNHAPSTFTGAVAAGPEGQRRLALADWIAHPGNPLTWRSAVNRVWHGHFGRGIVGTPNDFGRMGERPSHPELLDFLAARFRDSGGSLKALHREIVTSAAYRQSSAHRPDATAIDGGNRLLWRANRRRLESEALRDAVLAASGSLDLAMGGPGFRLFAFEDDHSPRYLYGEADPNDPSTFRRSIYRLVVRSVPDPWMTAFDCADPSHSTPARSETTTPLQALSLLNDRFLLAQAGRFAARLREEVDAGQRIERATALVWQRSPTPEERELLSGHAEAFGLEAVCRVLFNSSEFLYVD